MAFLAGDAELSHLRVHLERVVHAWLSLRGVALDAGGVPTAGLRSHVSGRHQEHGVARHPAILFNQVDDGEHLEFSGVARGGPIHLHEV